MSLMPLLACKLFMHMKNSTRNSIAPLLGQTNVYGLAKAGAKIKADQPQVLQPIKHWLLCRVWATNEHIFVASTL